MARRVVPVGHSGGATIAAFVLGQHPDLADAALLVACGCGPTRRLQPRDVASGVRRDVIVRLLVGKEDAVTPPDVSLRYAEVLQERGIDAQVTVLPGLGPQPHAHGARIRGDRAAAEERVSRRPRVVRYAAHESAFEPSKV